MALESTVVLTVVTAVLKEAIPAIIEAVKILLDSPTAAEDVRTKPLVFSVAFGGGDGEAVKVQRVIEGALPPSS